MQGLSELGCLLGRCWGRLWLVRALLVGLLLGLSLFGLFLCSLNVLLIGLRMGWVGAVVLALRLVLHQHVANPCVLSVQFESGVPYCSYVLAALSLVPRVADSGLQWGCFCG